MITTSLYRYLGISTTYSNVCGTYDVCSVHNLSVFFLFVCLDGRFSRFFIVCGTKTKKTSRLLLHVPGRDYTSNNTLVYLRAVLPAARTESVYFTAILETKSITVLSHTCHAFLDFPAQSMSCTRDKIDQRRLQRSAENSLQFFPTRQDG